MARKTFLTPALITIAVLALLATTAIAGHGPGQGPRDCTGHGPGHGPHAGMDKASIPEERAEIHLVRLTHRLDLTEEQKAQLLPILLDQAEQARLIHDQIAQERQVRREQMETIREDTHARIETVLDPDQLEKFQQMLQEREEMRTRRDERHRDRMERHPGGFGK